MKNKKELIIGLSIVLVVVLIGIFLGTRLYHLKKYTLINNENEYINIENLKLKDEIAIDTKILNDNDYLEANGIKIKNDFKEFTLLEDDIENHERYVLRDKNGKTKASFWFGYADYDDFVQIFDDGVSWFGIEVKVTNEEVIEYFENNNIKSEIDLVKYLNSIDNLDNSIFTSVKQMKENYISKLILKTFLHSNNYALITGDYKGYIIDMTDSKEAYIFKDNKKYVFTFLKTDYFTNEYINDLLNTVIIEDR